MLSDLLLEWEWQLAAINGLRLSKFEDSIIPLTFVRSDGVVYDIKSDGWNRNSQCGLTPIWQIVLKIQKEIIRLYVANSYLGYSFFSVKKLSNRELNERYSSLILDFPAHLFDDEQLAVETITNSLKTIKTPSETIGNSDRSILVLWNYKGSGNNKLKSTFSSLSWSKVYFGELSLDSTNPIWSSFGGNQYRFSFESDSVANIGDMFNKNELENYLSYWFSVLLHGVPENEYIGGGFVFHPASVKEEVLTSISIPFAFHDDEEIHRFYDNYRHLNISLHAFTAPLERRLRILQFAEKRDILSTRTAIGSIMSRNGSHNIGSHVLAALADNIGTMPDDRVLYQYIQHRMDYIATATTEFPVWRQPTMFLGNMMKNLLSQRHLLDNIAGSEGLKAWKFQGREANSQSNNATIKFFIRKELGDGIQDAVWRKEILTDHENGGKMNLDEDVSLAIPGGTVGQHAFFTIVENIIRNAAKHDWSSPPDKTKCYKYNSHGEVTGNLEIFIDYKDIPEQGNVEFTISTNMSDANDKSDGLDRKTALLDQIKKSFKAQFIDERGNLRKENWGIAEMKISAGYLQSREPGVIGGIEGTSTKARVDVQRFGSEIITPVSILDSKTGVYHLGYRFKVPKTRALLIVTNDACLPPKLDDDRKKLLAKFGLYIRTANDTALDASDNSFEFVLMDAFTEDRRRWRLPFRVVCTCPKASCERTSKLVAEFVDEHKEFVDKQKSSISVSRIVETLVECPDDRVEETVNHILELIAASWIKYLKKKRNIDTVINLVVATETSSDNYSGRDNNHSGQSLVNAAATVKFVFEEGFDKAIKSFWGLISVDDYPDKWCEETDAALRHVLKKAQQYNIDDSIKQSDEDIPRLIVRQLSLWMSDCDVETVHDISEYLKGKIKGGDAGIMAWKKFNRHPFHKFVNYLTEVCIQAKGYLGQYAEQITTLPKKFISTSNREEAKSNAEANENGPIPNASQEGSVWQNAGLRVFSDVIAADATAIDSYSDPTIRYHRHYTPIVHREDDEEEPEFITSPFKNTSNLYIEPLSGTQSYLTQMRLMMTGNRLNSICNIRMFQSKLVECALMRILIVDERVSRFVNNHSDLMLATFALMNIAVADDKMVTDELESRKNKNLTILQNLTLNVESPKTIRYTNKGLVKLDVAGIDALRFAIRNNHCDKINELAKIYLPFKDRFDILVIHQGILDKWFQGVVNDKEKMSILYDSFKKVFPYVIITTGRGTPANIPDMARVLPFSTIETTLFRKYPEKLILVDAIMNILPIRKNVWFEKGGV